MRIQDHHYQPEHQGSQSAFVSNEFVEEDDYYCAHLGATGDDLQEEDYYPDGSDYDYCYVGIAEDAKEPPAGSVGQTTLPFHAAYLSAGIDSPSSMARIHKLPINPIPSTINH